MLVLFTARHHPNQNCKWPDRHSEGWFFHQHASAPIVFFATGLPLIIQHVRLVAPMSALSRLSHHPGAVKTLLFNWVRFPGIGAIGRVQVQAQVQVQDLNLNLNLGLVP